MKKLIAALSLLPVGAMAHTDGGSHMHTVFDGLAHPFFGVDHLLALIAAGLCAAYAASVRRSLSLQLALLAALGLGIASAGVLPTVNLEPVMALSLIVLGVWVNLARRAPWKVSGAVLASALFAHGWVHGQELTNTHALPFALGLMIASALVIAAAALAGNRLARTTRHLGNLLLGAVVAVVGLLMAV